MGSYRQDFTSRQYMITPDFELFHYRDEPGVEIGYHNHDFYEIFYFISGKVTYFVEGTSYRLKGGDILLVNNRELHKPVIEKGFPYERIVLWVNPEFLKRQSTGGSDLTACFESSSLSRINLLRPEGELSGIIRSIFGRLEKASTGNRFGCDILQTVYVTELIVHLNRAFEASLESHIEIDIGFNEKISSIISYINENLDGELTLDYLSERCYLSKYHLLREFKKYTGYTIHSYISKKRLIQAKALLREGMQVSEVSVRCGFGDYSNFIRSFKKAFGLSPGRYGGLQ